MINFIKKHLLGIVGTGVIITACSLGYYNYQQQPEPKSVYELYEQFGNLADTNKDGDLTQEELIAAYHELGLKYDARNPMDFLSEEQMRRYINLERKLETGLQ